MGYHTDFTGVFKLDRPLSVAHMQYLKQFNQTRRMKRNAELTSRREDPIRLAVGLPVGEEGGYFVGARGDYGQEHGANDIVEYNYPPKGQPGLWCQWTPTEDGTGIEWDGGEKFYDYVKWIEYLIDHFLKPWGYVVNGGVEWEGESRGDLGLIMVKNNIVIPKKGRIAYSV